MARDLLTGTLQENLLATLAHSDEHGKVVANLVNVNLFEGDYRFIAERIVDFWKRHECAPKIHTPDLFSDILEDKSNRLGNTYRRILSSMFQLHAGINHTYVLGELKTFVRTQRLKDAVLKSAEVLNQNQEASTEEIEELWHEILRSRESTDDLGTFLSDIDKMLSYFDRQYGEFVTGINLLDKRFIVPARNTLMTLLGSTGHGKTWWLIHLGKHAIMQRKKVMHISLEMAEEEVMQRYYQSLFSIPKREAKKMRVTTLDMDDNDKKLVGISSEEIISELSFNHPNIRKHLIRESDRWIGPRIGNVKVKRFPPRYLTPSLLRGYMDQVEIVEKFIPDILLVDYPQLMKTNARDHRIDIGRNIEEIRAICVERNIAGAIVHQTGRAGATAKQISTTHVAEDWTVIQTSDVVLNYSCTEQEFRHGLARLYVGKARTEQDRFGMLITQNYGSGQFVLESALLGDDYWQTLSDFTGEAPDVDGGDEEE